MCRGSVVDTLERRHVAVVATARNQHMLLGNIRSAGGIDALPGARPCFEPRVALRRHGRTDGSIDIWVQIARRIPSGYAGRPQQRQRDVDEILADASTELEGGARVCRDVCRSGLVREPLADPRANGLDGFARGPGTGNLHRDLTKRFVDGYVCGRVKVFVEAVASLFIG